MPPPKGCIDVYHDAASNTFKAKDDQGNDVLFSGTADPGSVTTGDLVTEPSNGNPEAGDLGEIKSNGGISQILSSATPQNLATITLTPGDWDVWASVGYTETLGPVTIRRMGINTTSATLPGTRQIAMDIPTSGTFGTVTLTSPPQRFSVAVNTTIYLVGSVTFGGGTIGYDSNLVARRVR